METEDSPLIITGMPGLPVPNDIIHVDSYGGCGCNVWSTASPPRFLEFIGAPESAKLLKPFTNRSG